MDGKVTALACDNQLFVKPTEAGRSFIGEVVEAPPYPGARMSFLIEDGFEDRDWISDLVRITAKELPEPKPKKKKQKKRVGPFLGARSAALAGKPCRSPPIGPPS